MGKYRLPTEAEWEYACRAGSKTAFFFGDDYSSLGEYAWYKDNALERPHIVGQKKPNAWGLYDMHGNVWEMCQDWYGNYPSGHVTDPKGPNSGQVHSERGGSYGNEPKYLRSACRAKGFREGGSLKGFRVARDY